MDPNDLKVIHPQKTEKCSHHIDLGLKTPMSKKAEKKAIKDLLDKGKIKVPKDQFPYGVIEVRAGLHNYFIKIVKKN